MVRNKNKFSSTRLQETDRKDRNNREDSGDLFRNLEFIQPKPVSEKSDAVAQPVELDKSPVVAEFLGQKQDFHYSESELLAQLDRLLEV